MLLISIATCLRRGRLGEANIMKLKPARFVVLINIILIGLVLLSSCSAKETRLPKTYIYSPGAAFTANINDVDYRRVVKCTVVFQVSDEAAVTELADYNFTIRNSVITTLGELTMDELTTNRDLSDISQRIVTQVNAALPSYSTLIIGAYFTEFTLS